MEDGTNDYSNGTNDSSSVNISGENDGKCVIDIDKEEGELEEGEIDLDSDLIGVNVDSNSEVKNVVGGDVKEMEVQERSKRVDSIREELENLDVAMEQKSYDRVCSSLEMTANSLQKIVLEGSFTEKDTLVQLLLAAIQTLYSVFYSMTVILKEQNKAVLLRLVAQVINLEPPLFSSLQLRELEGIRASVESSADPLSNGNNNGRIEAAKADINLKPNNNSSFLKTCGTDSESTGTSDQSQCNISVQYLKSGLVNSRQKGMALPLLDLHKDHDADSLPSPTRDLSTPLPFEHGLLKPEWPIPRCTTALARENLVMHPYETDAVKAVSSYQQKFGSTSFFMSDNLPSPTPSEEGDATGDGEIGGEVSSFITQKVNPTVNTTLSGQRVVSSTAPMEALADPESSNSGVSRPVNSSWNPVLKSSSLAKSRDPRLRLANLDVPSSQKHKIVEEQVSDGPALKRLRNELSGPNAPQPPISTSAIPTTALPVSGSSPVTSQSEILPVTNSSTTSSLHSLLRDIVVNPSVWMDILKKEQNKSSDDVKSMTQLASTNSLLGAVQVPSTTSGVHPLSSVLGQISTTGIVQTPTQAVSVEEPGKVRMKPRDPRRILYSSTPLKCMTAASDQPRLNTSFSSSKMNTLRHEDQLEKKSVSSGSVKPPDIAKQFTSNLRNIADLMSVSQECIPASVPPQIPFFQPVQVHQARKETKGGITDSGNLKNSSDVTSEAAVAGPPRPLNANAWSDVEHLFEGFDDQQKAAIQRERARRLEEQKKMFAVRKLCLVLDLDHTLLNSAKFIEVDPLHDEMLKKKEEQDREKPQRHLFRFPHMGMWTKLRPGIWNFLEKASKLYELHLYTMGNKYYATEMAKLLDPKGELFSGRVISRGDDGEPFDGDDRAPKSKDLEGVLGMESAVVIIDDSVRVWPHNKLNLIVVERYIYFPCSRRQFGLPGPSLLEIDHDERPEDGTLASSLAVIERIHQNFFAHQSLDEADVRNILASEQRKILAGCRIVFSRVFPVGEANPHMHPLWQTAEQFGAVCINQIDEKVTHVVANSLGTDKVNWALSRGRFVVHPGWVEASALLYRRVNELDFAIKQP
ncbi:RNA polymerase II C-terminal domain phosphatase-like 3 [Striga hermonthica]|uniref:protein-serine/threonine phosphatase n=1 Tax=Striga hermonthica TaxID=68872 RepID=A0A9N7RMD5_STRHE|nr:RNA polymerase II C-terminal domain phosphatase-like 3 [Striga hermonthica]